jgi:uncharacterized protein YjbI with pentapeptide repeats
MSEAQFVCECPESCRSACKGLGFYRELEGKKYCVLHCPVQDKVDDFNIVLQRKLSSSEYDFRGVYFPTDVSFTEMGFDTDAYFDSAMFSADAHFHKATFGAEAKFYKAKFIGYADFSSAKFIGDADFSSAKFSAEVYFSATFIAEANFHSAKFIALAYFHEATFGAKARFYNATFSGEAYFHSATFSAEADFSSAKIESYVRFIGSKAQLVFKEACTKEACTLKFELAQIAKPEQMIFHTVRLPPRWFVNVDSRKFEFTNIDWGKTTVLDDLKALELENVENRHRLLSIAYRQLATNAEDNNRYGEAAHFRYASMDARRLERWRGWNLFTLDWWYWLISGYSERIWRAFMCLLVLVAGFSVLFTKVGFENKVASEIAPIVQEMTPTPPLPKDLPLPSFRDGLTYAMSAALFQRPEPKAYTFWAKICVSLEMIFVPLQAALLALAIRRRFMR